MAAEHRLAPQNTSRQQPPKQLQLAPRRFTKAQADASYSLVATVHWIILRELNYDIPLVMDVRNPTLEMVLPFL